MVQIGSLLAGSYRVANANLHCAMPALLVVGKPYGASAEQLAKGLGGVCVGPSKRYVCT